MAGTCSSFFLGVRRALNDDRGEVRKSSFSAPGTIKEKILKDFDLSFDRFESILVDFDGFRRFLQFYRRFS